MNLNTAFDIVGKNLGYNIDAICDFKIEAWTHYKNTSRKTYNLTDKEATEWASEFMNEDLNKNFDDEKAKTLIDVGMLATAENFIKKHKHEQSIMYS